MNEAGAGSTAASATPIWTWPEAAACGVPFRDGQPQFRWLFMETFYVGFFRSLMGIAVDCRRLPSVAVMGFVEHCHRLPSVSVLHRRIVDFHMAVPHPFPSPSPYLRVLLFVSSSLFLQLPKQRAQGEHAKLQLFG